MRCLLSLALVLSGCSSAVAFDPAKWKSADLDGRVRAEMLPDLLNRHPLQGMSKTEVISLLGEPTPTDKWEGADMIYVLGNDGSYTPIDHEWLLIKLDGQGRVSSFETVKD